METRNTLASSVRSARESLGLTQQALAAAAGFASLQIVSAIENGQREVKAWELVRLARALHTPVDVLLGLDQPTTARVFWRRGSGGVSAQREAQLRERAERFAQLELMCELPAPEELPDHPFDPERASFADAERLARSVAATLDLGSRPAASLIPVLEERFRAKLFYDQLGPDESAACTRGRFGAAVLLNAAQAPWRRNFSLAHELFHLVTWTAVEGRWPEDAEPEWSERLETLADVFASQLLLPAEEVSGQIRARTNDGRELAGSDVVELAREFGVSTEALAWRLVHLRIQSAEWVRALLADPEFRRRDRITMPARWSQPEVPFPERYRRLALLAYGNHELSLSKLATFMEMSIGEANAMLERAEHGQEAEAVAP